MAEERVYDVIVVGAGIVGSYTAYHSCRAGKSTCLLEQFPLPHTRGSSHGQSRTIRSAYGDKEYYTKMMTKAFQMWRQLEELSNQTLFKQTGLLCIGQKGINYIDETATCLQKNRTPFRRLNDGQLRDTYPMLSFPQDIGGAVLDLSGGLILAGRALTAIQNQYQKLGGLLKDGERMMKIIPGKIISVKTEARLYRAKAVVLCVGPWASKILNSIGLDVSLQNTPDEDYILDRHPSWSNIVIGAGFSGHGFKLAPVVGEILSKLAIGLTPEEDLSYFRLNRFTKSHL